MKRKVKTFLSRFADFWKDLILLVLGIYLALWMENWVQDWQDRSKEQDYYHRLLIDFNKDRKQLQVIQKRLTDKTQKLESLISKLQSVEFEQDPASQLPVIFSVSESVSNYYFFSPQDFTYLSMRESGDFKLIQNDEIKSKLLSIYSQYKQLDMLQMNYQQGLDDEFIPLWVRNVDMLSQKITNYDFVKTPLFKNMSVFALNETAQRKSYVDNILRHLDSTIVLIEKSLTKQPANTEG